MPADQVQSDDPRQEDRLDEASAETSEESSPRGRLAGVADRFRRMVGWANAHRLKAALLGVAVLASVLGAAVTTLVLVVRHDPYARVTFEMTLDALEHGDLARAREWARALAGRSRLASLEEPGGPTYVFGAAAFKEAEDTWTKDKQPSYLLASRYLEESRDRGFPTGRRAEGLLMLGKSLFMSGQIAASRPVLREALRANQNDRIQMDIHRLLAEASMQDATPDFDAALENNTKYLEYRFLSKRERDEGLLQRAQILLRMNRDAQCAATLDQIPTDSLAHSRVIVVRGQLLMREARQLRDKASATAEERSKARGLIETAIKTLRSAQGVDTLVNEATRQSTYLIGVCFLELGDIRAAVEQFNQVRTRFPGSEEAFSSDLQEADLNRLHGRNKAAMACYRRLLGAITDPDRFTNPYFTLAEARERVLRAYDDYQRTQDFASALQLAGLMYPLVSRAQSMQMTAHTYHQWGENLLAQAEHVPVSKAEALEREGRMHLRAAGQMFLRLARLRIAEAEYPDDLWNAGENLLAGHAYRDAERVFRTYLNNESRRRNPRALVGLGEALLALGRFDEAADTLRQCIEFHPKHAMACHARLLASRACRETNKLEEAEKLLKENLNGEGITPKSEVWQDSLFDLGELLHDLGRFEEAAQRLEEAVARQPNSRRAVMGRYLAAESYRRRAQAAREELQKEVVENARIAHTKEIQDMLHAARREYEELKRRLLERRDKTELTELERRILRNCLFSIGDVAFQLGDFREAIKTYSIIANRYQSQADVLQAYLQIVRAYERLGEPQQARRTLQHARVVLEQMDKSADFAETTNHSRREWEELLTRLAAG
ncbi:MAG: tetratricopeptide repeat protein [Pirellulales bacterium]|nr:tetratricopeptide repeat protein [Pirellulales bacterium]